jgi:hypothetical protein
MLSLLAITLRTSSRSMSISTGPLSRLPEPYLSGVRAETDRRQSLRSHCVPDCVVHRLSRLVVRLVDKLLHRAGLHAVLDLEIAQPVSELQLKPVLLQAKLLLALLEELMSQRLSASPAA